MARFDTPAASRPRALDDALREPWAFLMRDVLPFWAERARGPDLGYLAELTPEGRPVPEAQRSCLVQARMLYTFVHAHHLSGEAWTRAAAEPALAMLTRRLRRPDGTFAAAASPQDSGPRSELVDFYDQAFVIFALAWWHRATGDPDAPGLARATLAALDRTLGDPTHGGWLEANEPRSPRRQNPHMHLLEATLAWFEATGDEAWLVPAREVLRLFHTRFFDAETGTLREFLDHDLSPLAGPAGAVREPGHHMEWVWLLLQAHRLAGMEDVLEPAARLHETARRHGIDREGLVVEAMDPQGTVLDPARLLWPQTEAVKAALAREEALGAGREEADAALAAMMRVHFPEGGPLWVNRVSPAGEPLSDLVPTRLLYHLTLCLAEHARLRGLAGQAPAINRG